VSRRALLQQKQQHPSATMQQLLKQQNASTATSKATAAAEKPWPRSVVLGFGAFCCVAVPYAAAWFLALHQDWRTALLGSTSDDENNDDESNINTSSSTTFQQRILQWMRHHFGEIDYLAISEPERLELQLHKSASLIPHKLEDEPTRAVRRQQWFVAQQNAEPKLQVRLYDSDSGSNDDDTATIVELPAATLANPEALRRAVPIALPEPVALDFPVVPTANEEEENDDSRSGDLEMRDDNTGNGNERNNSNIPSMSIYSLWHHHSVPQTNDTAGSNNNNTNRRMSPAQLELSRLDYEIAILKMELQSRSNTSNRAIDDIRHDLQQKQSERRRWQIKQWLGR